MTKEEALKIVQQLDATSGRAGEVVIEALDAAGAFESQAQRLAAFEADLDALCKRHRVLIDHEDGHGLGRVHLDADEPACWISWKVEKP